MEQSLKGKIAIVVGATRGVGEGVAIELGAAGARVFALGRTLKPGQGERGGSLEETVAKIEELGGEAIPVVCDATDDAAMGEIIAGIGKDEGRLDVLVNSVFSATRLGPYIGKRFWETPDLWQQIVDLGARTAYTASRHAAPLMIETASKHGVIPLIVNISGRGAVRYRYNVLYGVGKAATERMTRDMALDLKEHGVATVSIWPNGHAVDPAKPETMRYSGRAVAALSGDPKVMERSGQYYWSAQIGAEFGFTDENGNTHEVAPLTDSYSLDEA